MTKLFKITLCLCLSLFLETTPYAETEFRKSVTDEKIAGGHTYKIVSILYTSKGKPFAIIGGKSYHLNESVAGGKIIKFTPEAITIKFQDKESEYRVGDIISDGEAPIQKDYDDQNIKDGTLNPPTKDEIEQNFKDTSMAFQKEAMQILSPGSGVTAATDKYKNLIEELRSLVRSNPHSVWAADAQYIVAAYSMILDPKQQTIELAKLLKDYPDIHLQDWTKENLGFLMPKTFGELPLRVLLCVLYKQLGETEKLKNLCYESISKFPDKRQVFERILNKS